MKTGRCIIFSYEFVNGERRYWVCPPNTVVVDLVDEVCNSPEAVIDSIQLQDGAFWPEGWDDEQE